MPKSTEEILPEFSQVVGKVLEQDNLQLKYGTTAREVRDWDSLRHIEIVLAVEKHFKIRFNFAELQKFQNIGQMCDNIAAKLTNTV